MISFIRKSKFAKILSVFLAFTLIVDVFTPSKIFALTSGGKQPEFSSFEPIGTSEMVDIFSGDFTYNIPLLDIEGYPINISYHSGISMDQEASWVGLGWNINPGVINRNMRSLPDDFNGDRIKKEFNIKKNETYGITAFPDAEWFGVKAKKLMKKLKVGVGFFYNTYNGVGFEASMNPALKSWERSGVSLNTKISLNSESGLGVSPNICFSKEVKDKNNQERTISGKIGLAFNSRAGLQALTISTSVDKSFTGGSAGNPNKGKPYGFSVNGGSTFSFSAPAYTPHIEMPMSSTCFNISGTLGGAVVGAHPGGRFEGYYSAQYLTSNTQELSAYGYMYLQNGTSDYAMLDFNREKDGTFTEHTPALPLTNLTYDLYSVSGQGISGMYKPFRGDIGVVFDSKIENQSSGLELPEIEIGAGNTAHPGVNMALNFANSSSGKWSDKNDVVNNWAFTGTTTDKKYEPFYFKQAGEKTAENDNLFNSIGGYDPVRIVLSNAIDGAATASFDQESIDETTLVPTTTSGIPINPQNTRKQRARRNENISVMTANEAASYGEITQIENYPMNDFPICTTCTGVYKNRYKPTLSLRTQHNGSHISQITANRADGARYVYGIPAYNLKQEDVSFAVDGDNLIYDNTTHVFTGLTSYTNENSTGNKKGMDHYYDKTTLPEYAHSYLLTEVLSADYVDAKGDGPTPDDLGTYTKINYTAAYDKANPYHWRVPYENANYNEGLKSLTGNKGDDKANYIYGEKEIWYVHSIETKMYVAEFTLAPREDGLGVKDSKGGKNTGNPLQKLMKITLYSRQDRIKEANDITQKYKATPIKTVHFEYDYSLCPGDNNAPATTDCPACHRIPNNSGNPDKDGNQIPTGFPNQGGKLTLKKIYFTYGSSLKGKLSPYVFNYADFNHDKTGTLPYGTKNVNYSYDMKGYDRWGNYKPNPTNSMTTSEFSYVEQNDKSIADQYAAAWSLTSIQLPSGGLINIDYEADDYAFVQDRKAMQMVKIVGASDAPLSNDEDLLTAPITSTLYKDISDDYAVKDYLFFKLQETITAASPEIAKKQIKEHYFTDENGQLIKDMYYKFFLNLDNAGAYEYVPGYVGIGDYGAIPTSSGGTYNYGYVKIEHASIDDNSSDDASIGTALDLNPITYTGFNFTKLYLSRLAYGTDPEDGTVLQIFKSMLNSFLSAAQALTGINQSMRLKSFSKEFVPSKSFIRLYNPINSKKGGGLRVKRLTMSDSWESMTNNRTATPSNYGYITAEYGQEYDYTTTDAQGNSISSGVAAYEPLLGGDENPFREPVYFKVDKKWVPDEVHSQEKPYGESFFPGASVGYSKVTVRNLQHSNAKKHATGKVVHEFYTAKDFPTLTRKTGLVGKFPSTADDILSAVSPYYVNHTTASQGFVVELNDMHGKPKSQEVYAEDKGKPISGVRYNYKTKSEKKLDNDFLVMGKDGSIKTTMVGVDYDFVADMRQASSDNGSVGLGGNLDAFFAAIPGVTITVFPSASYEQTYFNSVATTKIINRYGILAETVAYDLGSRVSTSNRVLDAETGEVLLTETQNQFDDPVYSFKYPAHWAYQGMGPSYWNTGVEVNSLDKQYVMPGDEVSTPSGRGWLTAEGPSLKIIDRAGGRINTPTTLKVLRSGSRNQQNTPIGTVTMLKNPLENNNTVFNLSFENVLNTGAVEYSDEWRLFCECGFEFDPSTTIYNPYVKGTLGNWRAKKSYLFLTDRTQTRMNNNVNVRRDGVFTSFSPFWKLNSTKTAWDKNLANWTYTSQVTEYSPYGFELENKDALNRYSSAVYGYNNHLPIAVSSNAKYKEIAFDSFEDYDFDDCIDDHFSFEQGGTYVTTKGTAATVTEVKSHTGKRSILLTPKSTIKLRKIIVKKCL